MSANNRVLAVGGGILSSLRAQRIVSAYWRRLVLPSNNLTAICRGLFFFGVTAAISKNSDFLQKLMDLTQRCHGFCDTKSANNKALFLETRLMAKFYIQSGKVSFIVCASDTEGAALWVMHRIMDRKICEFEQAQADWADQSSGDCDAIEDPSIDVPQAIPYDAMLDGLAEFGESISLSERGFGRNEAGELKTEDIFHQWRQLMLAVDRLHDELG